MKVTIRATPTFEIEIGTTLADALIEAARHHYDDDCRRAGHERGSEVEFQNFLWKSRNLAERAGSHVVEMTLDGREADVLCKIIEGITTRDHDAKHEALMFGMRLRRAFAMANDKVGGIAIRIH